MTNSSFIQLVLKHQWGLKKSNNNYKYVSIVLRSSTMFVCMGIFAQKYFATKTFKKILEIRKSHVIFIYGCGYKSAMQLL